MPGEKIKVIAYSGHRGEETPRAFILRGKRIEVVQIQESWIEEGFADRATRRLFKVKGNDGVTHKISYDEKTTEWYDMSEN
jgi:hypothetical protein